MTLTTHTLSLGYGDRTVVAGLDLTIRRGELTALVGPNGCGKSTILRGLSRLLPPRGGEVRIEGDPLRALAPKELARRLALLPQRPVTPPALTVRELVARGRYPHQRFLQPWTPEDGQAVDAALADVDLVGLAEVPVESLSGGQAQRAWVALVLAQQTPYVLLDEPTTFLDLAHAVEVMDVVARTARVAGKAVVAVLHDLTLAARYADRLVVVDDGQVVADGLPAHVLSEPLLAAVFGLSSKVIEVDGAPVVVPLPGQLRTAAAPAGPDRHGAAASPRHT
jgi:iron complex transport system ATP-binding protein